MSGISEAVGDEKGSDNRWGISSILTNVKEKKFVSGYKQWCVDKCLITGSAKKEIGNICQFLWCTDFHWGQFQASNVMSVNVELGREAHNQLVSRYELAPAHRWIQESWNT